MCSLLGYVLVGLLLLVGEGGRVLGPLDTWQPKCRAGGWLPGAHSSHPLLQVSPPNAGP